MVYSRFLVVFILFFDRRYMGRGVIKVRNWGRVMSLSWVRVFKIFKRCRKYSYIV